MPRCVIIVTQMKLRKLFCGLLICCLSLGLQPAYGFVLCIGADGQVSIEMTCRTSVFPQQHRSTSFPLRSDILSDQDGNSHCDKCVMDIPIPGISDGVRVAPSDPPLLLSPVYHLSALFSNDSGRDECKAASYWVSLPILDHSISILRTTVLLI